MASEEIAANWARVHEWRAVDEKLGEHFAGEYERVKLEFARGQAQAFAVAGEGYLGLLLLRFERRIVDGAIQCHLITAQGSNMKNAAGDLARLAKRAGAVALTADLESAALVRAYAAAGWDVESCRMRIEL